MFNCHINTEVVVFNRSIKYLFKYILKGHDSAAMKITSESESNNSTINHDEINM